MTWTLHFAVGFDFRQQSSIGCWFFLFGQIQESPVGATVADGGVSRQTTSVSCCGSDLDTADEGSFDRGGWILHSMLSLSLLEPLVSIEDHCGRINILIGCWFFLRIKHHDNENEIGVNRTCQGQGRVTMCGGDSPTPNGKYSIPPGTVLIGCGFAFRPIQNEILQPISFTT